MNPTIRSSGAAILAIALGGSAPAIGQELAAGLQPAPSFGQVLEAPPGLVDQPVALAAMAGGPDAGFAFPEPQSGFTLKPGGVLQFRYDYHNVDGDDEDDQWGFFFPRVRLWLNGTMGETFSFRVRAQFSGTEKLEFAQERTIRGIAELDQAWINVRLDEHFGLRFGQMASEFSRENDLAPEAQLGVNASPTDTVFGFGGYQGIRLAGQWERIRAFLTFSDGMRNKNTDWTDPRNADFGLTAKADWLLAGEWGRFSDFTSRPGSPFAAMLGAGIHWENGARVGSPGENLALVAGIVELSFEGDGWNFFTAIHGFQTTFLSVDNDELFDYGFVTQGGVYVCPSVELFARFDAVFPDSVRPTRNDEFKTITVGANYYFFPESNALKFSADVMYMLDDQAGSLVGTSTNSGVAASADDGQAAVRVQVTMVF